MGFVFGGGDFGELVEGFCTSRKPFPSLNFSRWDVVDVAMGAFHGLLLNKAGELLSWGNNDTSALGRESDRDEMTPGRVDLPEGTRVRRIACGDTCSSVVTVEGKLIFWGSLKVGFSRQDNV